MFCALVVPCVTTGNVVLSSTPVLLARPTGMLATLTPMPCAQVPPVVALHDVRFPASAPVWPIVAGTNCPVPEVLTYLPGELPFDVVMVRSPPLGEPTGVPMVDWQ